MPTPSKMRHLVLGNRYQSINGTPAQSNTGTKLRAGQNDYRGVFINRTGFFLKKSGGVYIGYQGQGVSELPQPAGLVPAPGSPVGPGWPGTDMDVYALASDLTWKRFLNVDIKMTCVPDPQTGTGGSPPNAGTGTSKHRIQGLVNPFNPFVTITQNATTAGSGWNAQYNANFSTYVISDIVTVVTNSDTEVEIQEVIDIGWDDGSGSPPSTVFYTVTLDGHWYNGRLAGEIFFDAWNLYQSVLPSPWGFWGYDNSGNVISLLPPPIGGSIAGVPVLALPSEYPAQFPSPGGWPSSFGTNYPCFGYACPSHPYYEYHAFLGIDAVIYNTHVANHPAGTGTWSIKKYPVAVGLGTLGAPTTIAGPTRYSNDRFVCEPDGTPNLLVLQATSDELVDFESNAGFGGHFGGF